VEFEGDSLEVVQAVNRESPCWKSYGHLIADIQTKLLVFHRYICSPACGHADQIIYKAAHGLAKLAVNLSLDFVWNGICPESIRDVVLAEQAFFS
jgi:phage tail protein X